MSKQTLDPTETTKSNEDISAAALLLNDIFNSEIFKDDGAHESAKSALFQKRKEIKGYTPAFPPLLPPTPISGELAKKLFQFPLRGEELETENTIKDEGLSDFSMGRIALLDTGVFRHHDEFILDRETLTYVPIDLESANDRPDGADVEDFHGHGTHIAGIISANGQMKGVVPGAPIVSYKITNDHSPRTNWFSVANALQKVVNNNLDSRNKRITVVNISFNALMNLEPDIIISERIRTLIRQLYDQNVPVVVSGGNYYDAFARTSKPYGLAFPANVEYVIAAGSSCFKGSIQWKGDKKDFSDRDLGPFSQRPDTEKFDYNTPSNPKLTFIVTPAIATPSLGISSKDSYSALIGSSTAAPIITGIIYLLQLLEWKTCRSLPKVDVIAKVLKSGAAERQNSGKTDFGEKLKSPKYFDNRIYLHAQVKETVKFFREYLEEKMTAGQPQANLENQTQS